MMAKAKEKGVKLLLPVDTVTANEFPDPIDAPVDTGGCARHRDPG